MRGTRYFSVTLPFEVTVTSCGVVDAYLDVSDVPAYVPAYREFTAGDLGVRLVKIMADGSEQIDADPAVYFNWIYMPSCYGDDHFYTYRDGSAYNVTVCYGGLSASFTVTAHEHQMTFVPASSSETCTDTGCIDHWRCDSCGRTYAEAEAVTELPSVSDGVYGPHTPGGPYEGFAPTCTAEGLVPYFVCAVCGRLTDAEGELLADPLRPAGHDLVWGDEIAPSCVDAGIRGHYTCALCGQTFGEDLTPIDGGLSIEPLGHDWGDWQVVKQATQTEEGLIRRVCLNDAGHVEEETVPRLSPQTNAFRQFIQRISAFFQGVLDWFRQLLRT